MEYNHTKNKQTPKQIDVVHLTLEYCFSFVNKQNFLKFKLKEEIVKNVRILQNSPDWSAFVWRGHLNLFPVQNWGGWQKKK